jgi:hypothetical protein
MTVTQELAEVAKLDPKGTLYPADAVEFARLNKESTLNACLEWDDHVAAEKYRCIQMEKLILGVKKNGIPVYVLDPDLPQLRPDQE